MRISPSSRAAIATALLLVACGEEEAPTASVDAGTPPADGSATPDARLPATDADEDPCIGEFCAAEDAGEADAGTGDAGPGPLPEACAPPTTRSCAAPAAVTCPAGELCADAACSAPASHTWSTEAYAYADLDQSFSFPKVRLNARGDGVVVWDADQWYEGPLRRQVRIAHFDGAARTFGTQVRVSPVDGDIRSDSDAAGGRERQRGGGVAPG